MDVSLPRSVYLARVHFHRVEYVHRERVFGDIAPESDVIAAASRARM